MIKYICDGCQKEQLTANSLKPHHWFVRSDEDGEQHACSRPCIEKVARASGKTGLVLPI